VATLYQSLQKTKTLVDLIAAGLVLFGILGTFTPNKLLKETGFTLFSTGIFTLGLNLLSNTLYAQGAGEYLDQALLESESKFNSKILPLKQHITDWETFWHTQSTQFQREKELASTALQTAENLREEVVQTAEKQHSSLMRLHQQYKALQTEHSDLQSAKEAQQQDYQQICNSLAVGTKTTLKEAIASWQHSLTDSIENVEHRMGAKYPDLSPKLKALITETNALAEAYNQQINALDPAQSPASLIEQALSLLHHATAQFSTLKVKLRNSLNVAASTLYQFKISALEESLKEVVPRSQHEAILTEFKLKKDESFGAINDYAEKLETELHGATDQYVQQIVKQLEAAGREIESLKSKITDLSQPLNFSPATRDDLRMANVAIAYFQNYGITLDRAYSDYRKWEAIIYLHIDRNPKILVPSELNDHSDRLQPLLNCLNVPKFDYDSEQGLIKLRVQIAAKPKADVHEIQKLWKNAEQFAAIVSKWERIRITGGSEAGKSPTAENIAICILKHRTGSVKLANPQHDSQKNHWTIPVQWTSHKDAVAGLKELSGSVEQRSTGDEPRDEFRLYLFDEIDSTMEQFKQSAGLIKNAIKQASHQNLGAIFIGQNANVKNYVGMDRSDWNNAVNIHIGANAYDALTNSNLPTSEQASLKEKADKLTAYCESRNKELDFERSDPDAYRFALVIEPAKKPYFIELPAFGRYTYNSLIEKPAETPLEFPLTQQHFSAPLSTPSLKVLPGKACDTAGKTAISTANAPICPHCSSAESTAAGSSGGHKYRKCKSCGKKFKTPELTPV
jgi:hypothetical protein